MSLPSATREPWCYNPVGDNAIVLDGCQLGLGNDGRCNMILCKFRTRKDLERKPPMKDPKAMCPREMTYESKKGVKKNRARNTRF